MGVSGSKWCMWGLVVGMAGVWVYVHLCCTAVGDVRICT